jgi:hypothetical protein
MNDSISQRFISEPLEPVKGMIDSAGMERGEPGLPMAFSWRGEPLRIQTVLRTWRELGPDRGGSAEMYARKHWFEIETASGQRARLYFERQARSTRAPRWWLYSITDPQ